LRPGSPRQGEHRSDDRGVLGRGPDRSRPGRHEASPRVHVDRGRQAAGRGVKRQPVSRPARGGPTFAASRGVPWLSSRRRRCPDRSDSPRCKRRSFGRLSPRRAFPSPSRQRCVILPAAWRCGRPSGTQRLFVQICVGRNRYSAAEGRAGGLTPPTKRLVVLAVILHDDDRPVPVERHPITARRASLEPGFPSTNRPCICFECSPGLRQSSRSCRRHARIAPWLVASFFASFLRRGLGIRSGVSRRRR
jgi:hypothetical protein